MATDSMSIPRIGIFPTVLLSCMPGCFLNQFSKVGACWKEIEERSVFSIDKIGPYILSRRKANSSAPSIFGLGIAGGDVRKMLSKLIRILNKQN